MERDCESELSKLNIEQNACIYHFGASVIHGQRSNILRLLYTNMFIRYSLFILLVALCIWRKNRLISILEMIIKEKCNKK